eukprot:TRINITY_DN56822_c0_g1_i1.p1 TRINITY_DN56822_c0_g1~~TRINITY_DN56822_c0_g1_i1.p1  ORF type:complete len:171 (-),score=38.97 TRINITY_DN56822_c0_g1_i1:161-673(-)
MRSAAICAAAALSALAATVLAKKDIKVIITAGDKNLDVFWTGNYSNLESYGADYEQYTGTIAANAKLGQVVEDGHAFMIRQQGSQFRAKFAVGKNNDEKKATHPFWVAFKNIMRERNSAVELQHTGGYIWIEPGDEVKHVTDERHTFTIRDTDKELAYDVAVYEASRDEL